MVPKVSCIIIFLNSEKYIAEAIESVLSQSFQDWELILVDDGTTDGATDIARRYARDYPGKIVYTEHPGHENRGMSASRNAGIALARGEYIAFLDSDDVWLPDRLLRHVEVLEARPEVGMSMSPTVVWSSWNRSNVSTMRPWLKMDIRYELRVPFGTVLEPPNLARHYLERHGSGVPGICSVLIRRKALNAVGGFEDEFRRLYEDQVMLFKIFLEYRVIAINEVLDFYRQHSESACQVEGMAAGDARMRPVFLNWLKGHLRAKNVTDPAIWQALEGEIGRFVNPIAYKSKNPLRAFVGTWDAETRLAVVWLLTPKFYNWLRRRLGMKRVDMFTVPNRPAGS